MCVRVAHAPLIIRVPKGETSRITLKVARDVNYLTVRVGLMQRRSGPALGSHVSLP